MPFLNADLLGGELGDTPGTTLRILVVDDEPRLRRSLTLLLEGTDREIDECATGSEAIAALARRQYDLVLLDLRLPDVTGLEVMDWLAKRLPAMTVIVVSADDVIDSAIGALRRGAYDFVRKPYQPEELLRTVDNALQRKRLERTNALISARLERSERLHRYLVDHSPDIIYTVDEEGRFTYLNPTVATALGNRPDRADRSALLRDRARRRHGACTLCIWRAAHRRTRIAQHRAATQAQRGQFGGAAPCSGDAYRGAQRDRGLYRRCEHQRPTLHRHLRRGARYHRAQAGRGEDQLPGLPRSAYATPEPRSVQGPPGVALVQARRNRRLAAVLFIDLDRFKLSTTRWAMPKATNCSRVSPLA